MTKQQPTSPAALVEFRDLAFKSRTLVLDDGRTFVVEKSRIATDDPALIAYLEAHDDFERVAADAAAK